MAFSLFLRTRPSLLFLFYLSSPLIPCSLMSRGPSRSLTRGGQVEMGRDLATLELTQDS